MNKTSYTFDKFIHSSRLRAISRRGVAALLTLVMTVGLLPASFAANVAPHKQHVNKNAAGAPDGTGEAPTLTIEANAVVDEDGLTGFVEAALRVRPGVLYYDMADPDAPALLDGKDAADALEAAGGTVKKEIQPFNTMAVALRYNKCLTPWEWVDEDPNWDNPSAEKAVAVVPTGNTLAGKDMVPMSHAGSAYLNTVDARVSSYKDDTFGGYLYFEVKNNTPRDLDPEEDWVLGVVRFKYEVDGDDSSKNPLATNTDSAKWVTPGTDECLFQFVDPADIFDVDYTTIPLWECYYDGENNDFYYTAERDTETNKPSYGLEAPDPALTTDPNSMMNNLMEVNVVDPASGDDITLGKINFTLVNHITYNIAARGMTTLLFYDWDDELLGAQAVLPNRDVQEQVNDYVKEKLIHPNIAANVDTTYQSLTREDNYRGRYPFSGPTGPDSEKRTNGEEYPLTYKLDYTFFKRNMTLDETDPDNPIWKQDTTNAWNADYPLTEGWALCSRKTLRDTWTTLGAGELSDYAVTAGMDDASFTVADNMAFDFADFEEGFSGSETYIKAVYEPGDGLESLSGYSSDPKDTKFVRYGIVASTEDGSAYGIQFQYERINTLTGWGVRRTRSPAVRLAYTVDEQAEDGTRFFLRIDVNNVDLMDVEYIPSATLKSLEYALVDQYGWDFVTGEDRTAFGNMQQVPTNFFYDDFVYSNRKGTTGFVTSATLRQILIYAAAAYKPGADVSKMNALDGVLTLETFLDLNYKFGTLEGGNTVMDFSSGFLSMGIVKVKALFQAAYNAGLVKTFTDPTTGKEKEELDLDWHQIQYHILKSTTTGTGGAISGSTIMTSAQCIAAYGNFSWCRLHGAAGNCTIGFVSGGGSKPINSWDDLRKALAEYAYVPNGSALNQLNQTFDLRKGLTAQPFADVNALKTALTTLVADLKDNRSFSRTDVEGLSWKQVQYLLDLVNDGTGLAGITPATLPADSDITPTGSTGKNYWWEDGGSAPTISSWEELLTIQYKVKNQGYFAGDATTSGWRSGYDVSTAPALTGKVRNKDAAGNWITPTGPADASAFTTKSVALRQDGDGATFPTTDNGSAFVGALNTALTTLAGTYPGGSFTGVSLMEIQHAMINDNPYESEDDLMTYTVAGTINYWWITGAPTINNLEELVTWVKKVVDGAPDDLLEDVTVAKMSKGPFWLRTTGGSNFANDAALRGALKTAVATWCTNNPTGATWPAATNTNWNTPTVRQTWSQLQDLLLGNTPYDPDPDPGDGGTPPVYQYWWYADGSKPISDLASLLEAAWNSYGGPGGSAPSGSTDPNAMDALTEANLSFITGAPIYFRKNTDGDPFDSMDGTGTAFKAALKTAMQKITAVNPALSFTTGLDWIQVQYLLMSPTNNYRPATTPFGTGLRQDSSINYWWENGGSKPEESGVSYDEADALIAEYMGKATAAWDNAWANITPSDVSISIPADVVTKLNLQDGAGNVLTESQIIQYIVDAANEYCTEVWDNSGTSPWQAYENYPKLELDWKSFQYWILHRGETNIANKQLALKDKTYGQISAAPYNIPWTPAQPTPANYTKADTLISEYMGKATTAWDSAWANITTSDVSISISAADATALNLQDGGGNVLNESQITTYIVEAANEYCTAVWDSSGTSAWQAYENYPNLELDWKSFQYWILHKGEANIANKQLALKDKTEAEIGAAPYNITWAPVPPPPVNYTWADGKIAVYMGNATAAWDNAWADITTGDVTFSITAAEAAALNLQDGSGNVLNESQITTYIVEATNEYCTAVWDSSGTSAWQAYENYPNLELDWKSFQYWILHKGEANIADKQKALKDKTEAEIGADPYNITWGPSDAQPALLSLRTFKKVPARKPVTTEETTETVTTEDGLRTETTTTRTTTDPNTGIIEILEEVKTELIVGDKLVTTVDTTTTVINTKTGEYEKTKETGTPVITDLEPVESPAPTETVKPEETVAPTESPEATESVAPTETPEPTESPEPTETVKPEETVAPTESPEATESVAPTEPNDGTGDDNTDGPSSGTGDAGATFPPEGEGSEPAPAETPEPTESPEPTETVKPEETVAPTESPEATESVAPTEPNDGTGDDNTDGPSSGTGDAGATFPPEGEGSGQEDTDSKTNNNVGTAIPDGPEDSSNDGDGEDKTDVPDKDAPSSGASGATFPQEGEGSGQEDTDSKTNNNVGTAALVGPEDTTKDGTPKAACPTESIGTDSKTDSGDAVTDAPSSDASGATFPQEGEGSGQETTETITAANTQVMTMSSPAPALPQWVQDLQGEGKELPDWAMEKVLAGEEIPEWAILLMQAGKDIPPWAAELAQNGGELPQELATLVANGEDLPPEEPTAEAQSAEGESPPILEPEVDPPKPDDTGGGEDPADGENGEGGAPGSSRPTEPETACPTDPGGMATAWTQQSDLPVRKRFGEGSSELQPDQEFPNGSNTSSGRILL